MHRTFIVTEASTARDSLAVRPINLEVDYDVKLALVCMISWTLQGIFASVKDIKK